MQPALPSEPIQANLLLKSYQQLKKSLQRSKESEPAKKEKEFSPVWSSMKRDSASKYKEPLRASSQLAGQNDLMVVNDTHESHDSHDYDLQRYQNAPIA